MARLRFKLNEASSSSSVVASGAIPPPYGYDTTEVVRHMQRTAERPTHSYNATPLHLLHHYLTQETESQAVSTMTPEMKIVAMNRQAMNVAYGPGKQLATTAFMLWMSGSSIQIFSIMMTGRFTVLLSSSPIRRCLQCLLYLLLVSSHFISSHLAGMALLNPVKALFSVNDSFKMFEKEEVCCLAWLWFWFCFLYDRFSWVYSTQ